MEGIKVAARSAFDLLPPRQRRRFLGVVAVQVLLSSLDVLGVLLVTAVGILALYGAEGSSGSLPQALQSSLDFLTSSGLSIGQIILIFALLASIFFVAKIKCSLIYNQIYLNRRIRQSTYMRK